MAYLADDPDRSPMSFDDRFCDGQTHARALHAVALVRASVKFVED